VDLYIIKNVFIFKKPFKLPLLGLYKNCIFDNDCCGYNHD
jgi:hypothetical protein